MTAVKDFTIKQITTVDATPTALITQAIPNNTGGKFRLNVTARNTTTNRTANTAIEFGAQNLAGTAAILGTPTVALTVANGSDAAMAAVTVALSASAGNIVATATGIAATNIVWTGELQSLGG